MIFCSLYQVNVFSKIWRELAFVHYIKKFTITRYTITRFGCTITEPHIIFPFRPSTTSTSPPPTSTRSRLFGNRGRTRFSLNRGNKKPTTTPTPEATSTRPSATRNILRGRDRFRNLLARTTSKPFSSSSSQE